MNIKLLFMVSLAIHGIGHIVIGLMTFLDLWGMSVRSSILDLMGLNQGLIKALGFLWIIPFIAFIASAWGVWMGIAWWETAGWVGTITSVVYFVLFWNSFSSNIPIQANIGNVVALAGLLGFINIA
jgi:hypothetical protein